MAADSTNNFEADLIEVVDDSELDDFVQVLGVIPSDDDDEIVVQRVELDDGESVFIDVDEDLNCQELDTSEIIDTDDGQTYDSLDYTEGDII